MRGTPITGSARGVSITDTVSRGQDILKDRPEPRGRDRYAGRTNRPSKGDDNVARAKNDGQEPDGDEKADASDGTSVDTSDDTSREEA